MFSTIIIPLMIVAGMGVGILSLFLWSILHLAKKGHHKATAIVGLIVSGIFLFPPFLFCNYRAAEMTLYPKITIETDIFTYAGHHYIRAEYEKSMWEEHLHEVALVRCNNSGISPFFDLIFIPSRLYAQDNSAAPHYLWQHTLTIDKKFKRVD